jgi:hypothetical protein
MFEEMINRIAGRFTRVEPADEHEPCYWDCSQTCWNIAEHAGDDTLDGMQHLLRKAVWDADKVRDDLRDYVTEHFGNTGAVLVVDETATSRKASTPSGCNAIHRHRRAHRERPGRGLPHLRHGHRPRVHRPSSVPPEILDHRSRPLR